MAKKQFVIPVAAKESQPNILFIVADNQPASILGIYGNPDVMTPNIDRLANEGVRFTHAFAVHDMCSPTRATLLTGLLPSQHGGQDWLDDEEMGKWHLGQPRSPDEWFDYWVTFNLGHTIDFWNNEIRVSRLLSQRCYQYQSSNTSRLN